jgi:hypothetical protein
MMVGIDLFIRIFLHTWLDGNSDVFSFEKLCPFPLHWGGSVFTGSSGRRGACGRQAFLLTSEGVDQVSLVLVSLKLSGYGYRTLSTTPQGGPREVLGWSRTQGLSLWPISHQGGNRVAPYPSLRLRGSLSQR